MRAVRCLILIACAASAGCDFVDRYLSDPPETQLVDAALAQWAARGRPFLDGASGRDTVASVSPTGARSWEVAVIPPSGGAPSVWSLDVPRVEVYPVFSGDAFTAWLEKRARELGMRTFLPPDVAAEVRRGDIRAVGDLEVRYGPAERSGRNTEEHVAYLASMPGGEPVWRLQPETRSAAVLLEALRLVSEDMIHTDDRVLSCMGAASPVNVARDVQLDCLSEVLEQEFGEG